MSLTPGRNGRINVRRAEIMEKVEKEIQHHYTSELVDRIRREGNRLELRHTHFYLAEEFGFCNGVRRAIDIAYAARKIFPDSAMYLIGEIIHNPEVNRQLQEMDVKRLPWKEINSEYDKLSEGDVVIIPAFGVPTEYMDLLDAKGVHIIDTTCGDVMKVWRRVRNYAHKGITSIIHGKSTHEETRATASRALGDHGDGRYLVIFTRLDAEALASYIRGKGNREEFLARFQGCMSPGFDPDRDLLQIGIANQTTMLKDETRQIQETLQKAIVDRDGDSARFHVFDTICGATQDRQNALFELMRLPLDVMFVVGGYNSSNTTHLVEIAQKHLPTYFIETSERILSLHQINCFDIHEKVEKTVIPDPAFSNMDRVLQVGITAGASCPGNLVEETVRVIASLRQDTLPMA